MKNRKKRRQIRQFSFYRFVLILALAMVGLLWIDSRSSSRMPTSKELEVSSKALTVERTTEASTSSTEENEAVAALKNELLSRKMRAEEIFEADAGKLYVDETYGGNATESEGEMPIAQISIPALGFERQVWRGVGVSSSGVSGYGDFERLYKAATYRADQTLGGDNFTIVSHIWSGHNSAGKDFSNEWFSPLLTSVDGGMTTDISKIKLKKGDQIIATEFSSGLIFTFEISEITTVLHSNADGTMPEEVKSMLMARSDKPRITLQGCLMDTDQLFFVVGELKSVSNGSETYSLE